MAKNKMDKTDDGYREIKALATQHGITMEQLFSDPKYDESVIDILYPKLPKAYKLFTTKKSFLIGYDLKRAEFVAKFAALDANS